MPTQIFPLVPLGSHIWRIGNQLDNNQRHRDGVIDLYIDASLRIDMYGAMGNRRLHILADLLDIGAEVHAFNVVVAVQALMGAGYGGDAPGGFLKLVDGFLAAHIAGLHLQQAGDNGQAVFDPVVHFLHEELLAFERRLEMAFVPLALYGHAKDVGSTLQEGEVVFDKFILFLAIDLEHPKWLAIALKDDIHCPLDAMLDQHSGVRKRSSFSR